MRKNIVCIILALCMLLALCACGGSSSSEEKNRDSGDTADISAPKNEDDTIDDEAWDDLSSLGRIETENGLFYVSITLPEAFVGEDVTQASIDANAGRTYTSGKLNDDGSVTYKMTKKQHKAMLESISGNIEETLQKMIDSPDYSFTRITHNSDFTSFDVYVDAEEVGFAESLMVLGFYMYGGMYSVFTGKEVENVAVNYYSSSGALIRTANSSDMKE